MKNFWTGFVIAAVVAVLAVYLGRMTSSGTRANASTAFLIHVYETNGTCVALVGPKSGDASENAEVRWDRRNECANTTIDSIDIANFRQKSAAACEHDHSSGDPANSPVGPITDGPNGSKKTTVKPGAAHGQSRLPYCYDVTIRVTGPAGSRSIVADPEMDIVR